MICRVPVEAVPMWRFPLSHCTAGKNNLKLWEFLLYWYDTSVEQRRIIWNFENFCCIDMTPVLNKGNGVHQSVDRIHDLVTLANKGCGISLRDAGRVYVYFWTLLCSFILIHLYSILHLIIIINTSSIARLPEMKSFWTSTTIKAHCGRTIWVSEGGMIEMKKMAIFVLFGNYLGEKLIIQYSSLNLDKAWKG